MWVKTVLAAMIGAGGMGGAVGGDSESGSPFILTLNVPGGAATFTQTEIVPATSVNNIYDANNWSDKSLPGNGDTLVISNANVKYGYC